MAYSLPCLLRANSHLLVFHCVEAFHLQHKKTVSGLRGFVKLKKKQISEKNMEVDGCVKPQLGFLFFVEFSCVCFFVCCFHVCKC